MQVRTCWVRIAKRTMRWIAAVAGLFMILHALQDAEARICPTIPCKEKRSIDLHDVDDMTWGRFRSEVIPTSYILDLQPFIGNDKFEGRVRMNVTWTDTSDTIVLNVNKNIQVTKFGVRIIEKSFKEREKGLPLMDVKVARVNLSDSRKPTFTINLQQMLDEGSSCEVDISFIGNLTTVGSKASSGTKTVGLFKSEYLDSDGKTQPFIGTYLRLSNAQSMFPCMDIPDYKATFQLNVLYPAHMTALSNTILEKITNEEGSDLAWAHFKQTPKISTYQLALFISNFKGIGPTQEVNYIDGNKLEITVWGREEFLETLRHVPDKIIKIVNYLQNYFNSSIGLPKLDIVAVPSYSAAKASDSWGLILIKESELASSSVWNTAYELIYQWIGQYITPKHWGDAAPINKALNSFLASMTTVETNPDEMEGKWPMTMLYSLYYEFGKFKPFWRVSGMRHEAESAKMELVFRMFNYTLGKDLFQKGIRNLVQWSSKENQRKFDMVDIYEKLNDVTNQTNILPEGWTINSIAKAWNARDRIPLVTVIRDYETHTITFSQKVYLRETLRASTPKVSYVWEIPLVMMSQEKLEYQPPCRLWLTRNQTEVLTVPDTTNEEQFIIVNPEEIGMFPVNYDPCNWKMLSEFLRSDKRETIPVLTRAKLLHDSWNLAYSGELCFGIALNMTLFLKEERSHVVWEPVFMMFDHISRRIEGSDAYPKFEAYIRRQLEPLYKELNKTVDSSEPSWKTHMRDMAKNFLCRAGYEPCITEARALYKKWLEEDPEVAKPFPYEVICPVFKWGTEEEWEFGLKRLMNQDLKENERSYLLKSLAGCPKDSYKIERLLNITILDQNKHFKAADIQLIFVTLSGGATGYTTLFNFLVNNWEIVKQRLKDKEHLWYHIIDSAISSFSTQKGLDMARKLFMNNPEEFKPTHDGVQKAFIMETREWSDKNLPVIDAWLTEHLPKEELEAIEASATNTTCI